MVKIAFDDWWQGFDVKNNFITRILDNKIEYIIVENPAEADFLFCSIEKKNCFKYNCPRILFTGENYVPNFNFYDYAIGFEHMSFGDRYFRYPLYVACYENACERSINKKINGDEFNRDFCSFVVSNSSAEEYRVKLYEKLSEYRNVSSGGRYKNNIGLTDGVQDKNKFLKNYKFNIACENISHPGYCTEKIVEAFAANTIPIYWGDPDVEQYFNPKAFINCNKYENINQVVETITQIDNDNDRYMEMLSQPIILNKEYDYDFMREDFSKWLIKIVSQDKSKAYRRCFSGYSYRMETEYIAKLKMEEELSRKSLRNTINKIFGMERA